MKIRPNDKIEGRTADRLAILEALPLGSSVISGTGERYHLMRQGHWLGVLEPVSQGKTTWELLNSSGTLTVTRIGGNMIRSGTLNKLPVGSVVGDENGNRMIKLGAYSWRRTDGGALITPTQMISVMGSLRIIVLNIEESFVKESAPAAAPGKTEYGVEYWSNTMQCNEVRWGIWTTDPTERIAKDNGVIYVSGLGSVRATRVLSREVSEAVVIKDFEAERKPKSLALTVSVRVGDVVKDLGVIEALPYGTVLVTSGGNDVIRLKDSWYIPVLNGGSYSSEMVSKLEGELTVASLG